MSNDVSPENSHTADASPTAEAGTAAGPKAASKPARTSGLSPKEQKLQAMRAKLEAQKTGGKQTFGHSGLGGSKGAQAGHKKTSFQRKAT